MKIYISGPISGKPREEHEHVFKVAKRFIEELGHEAIDPHDLPPHQHDGECPPGYTQTEHSSCCYLRNDLIALLTCDGVFMLSGWESSIGARLEHSVAAHCGLQFFSTHMGETPPVEPGSNVAKHRERLRKEDMVIKTKDQIAEESWGERL